MGSTNNKFADFIREFQGLEKPKRVLSVISNASGSEKNSIDHIFPQLESSEKIHFTKLNNVQGKEYDLILGSIPLSLRGENGPFKNKHNWELIFQCSRQLSESGYGIFLIEPTGLGFSLGQKLIDKLAADSISVKGYVRPPKSLLKWYTLIEPIFVVTTKQAAKFSLVDLTESEEVSKAALQFLSDSPSGSDVRIDVRTFKGFNRIDIERQIKKLQTRYKDYKSFEFNDLVMSFKNGNSQIPFDDLDNCLYIRRVNPESSISTELSEIAGRERYYLQFQICPEVRNSYLKVFFKSKLGLLSIGLATKVGSLRSLDKEWLLSLSLPIPNLMIQNQIVENDRRLGMLQQQVDAFRERISLNPQHESTTLKIHQLLEISNSLTEGDKIKTLTVQGESKTLEFKESFQLCLHKQERADYVEVSSLKTLVGFLNSDGGTLLVGVADSGLIAGITIEIDKFHKGSHDGFLLNLKNKIKDRIGLRFLRFLSISIVEVDDLPVLVITAMPSNEEVFLDSKDFYVRNSPSTDKLEGRDFSRYVKSRFQ